MTVATALRRTSGTTFTPASLTSEAQYWTDDPSWTNPGDGNPVSTWRDMTVNGRDASQSLTVRPTFRSSWAALNNRPGIQFDGNNDRLNTTSFSVNQAFSIAIICSDWVASGTGARLVCSGTGIQTWAATGPNSAYAYAGTISAGVSQDTSPHLWVFYFNGASSAIEKDGSSTTVNTGTGNLSSGLTLGARGDGILNGAVVMAYVSLHSGDVRSQSNWSSFKSWAATTYGITIS